MKLDLDISPSSEFDLRAAEGSLGYDVTCKLIGADREHHAVGGRQAYGHCVTLVKVFNVTQVHMNYRKGFEKEPFCIAFESDVHSTGRQVDFVKMEDLKISLSKQLHDDYDLCDMYYVDQVAEEITLEQYPELGKPAYMWEEDVDIKLMWQIKHKGNWRHIYFLINGQLKVLKHKIRR